MRRDDMVVGFGGSENFCFLSLFILPQMTVLKIAAGELRLIEALRRKTGSLPFRIDPVGTNELPTGDLALYTDGGQPILFAERKTKADLLASLNDRRYAAQIARLGDLKRKYPWTHVGFIIETDSGAYRSNVAASNERMLHVLTSIIFKHNMFCLQTSGVDATATSVVDMANKVPVPGTATLQQQQQQQQDRRMSISSMGSDGSGSALNGILGGASKPTMKKKGEYFRDHFFAHQLALVRGVSPRLAAAIAAEHKSLRQLWTAWAESPAPEKLLISTSGGAKIGAVVSERIYQCFAGTTT